MPGVIPFHPRNLQPDQPRIDLDKLVIHADRQWHAEVENAERLDKKAQFLYAVVATLFGLGLFKVAWLVDPQHLPSIHPLRVGWYIRGSLVLALIAFGIAFYQLNRPGDETRIPDPAKLDREAGLAGLIVPVLTLCACIWMIGELLWGTLLGEMAWSVVLVFGLVVVLGFFELVAPPRIEIRDRYETDNGAEGSDEAEDVDVQAFASRNLRLAPELMASLDSPSDPAVLIVLRSIVDAADELRERNAIQIKKIDDAKSYVIVGVILVVAAMIMYLINGTHGVS